MRNTIEVPIPLADCARCKAQAPMRPQVLRLDGKAAPSSPRDSDGRAWRALAAELPDGWIEGPDGSALCGACGALWRKVQNGFSTAAPEEIAQLAPASSGPSSSPPPNVQPRTIPAPEIAKVAAAPMHAETPTTTTQANAQRATTPTVAAAPTAGVAPTAVAAIGHVAAASTIAPATLNVAPAKSAPTIQSASLASQGPPPRVSGAPPVNSTPLVRDVVPNRPIEAARVALPPSTSTAIVAPPTRTAVQALPAASTQAPTVRVSGVAIAPTVPQAARSAQPAVAPPAPPVTRSLVASTERVPQRNEVVADSARVQASATLAVAPAVHTIPQDAPDEALISHSGEGETPPQTKVIPIENKIVSVTGW